MAIFFYTIGTKTIIQILGGKVASLIAFRDVKLSTGNTFSREYEQVNGVSLEDVNRLNF